MAVGLILTAFGTQQSPVSQQPTCDPNGCSFTVNTMVGPVQHCSQGACEYVWYATSPGQSTQPIFTLNYFGMFLSVLGSVFFAALYPKRPSSAFPVNAFSLRLWAPD